MLGKSVFGKAPSTNPTGGHINITTISLAIIGSSSINVNGWSRHVHVLIIVDGRWASLSLTSAIRPPGPVSQGLGLPLGVAMSRGCAVFAVRVSVCTRCLGRMAPLFLYPSLFRLTPLFLQSSAFFFRMSLALTLLL